RVSTPVPSLIFSRRYRRLRRGSGVTQRLFLAWSLDNDHTHSAMPDEGRQMKIFSKRRLPLAAVALTAIAAAAAMGSQAPAGSKDGTAPAKGLGPISGLLPRDHLTEESAIQVDLSKESVRLPLYRGVAYKGTPDEETVWFTLL